MKCEIKECDYSSDCVILDITKKKPKDKDHCSYFHIKKQLKEKGDKDENKKRIRK